MQSWTNFYRKKTSIIGLRIQRPALQIMSKCTRSRNSSWIRTSVLCSDILLGWSSVLVTIMTERDSQKLPLFWSQIWLVGLLVNHSERKQIAKITWREPLKIQLRTQLRAKRTVLSSRIRREEGTSKSLTKPSTFCFRLPSWSRFLKTRWINLTAKQKIRSEGKTLYTHSISMLKALDERTTPTDLW